LTLNTVIHLADHKPNPHAAIIEMLETLLEEAKAGDIQGIALVYSSANGKEMMTAFQYESWFDAVGASALLHRDVLKSGDD
jgi:hypothetical protein